MALLLARKKVCGRLKVFLPNLNCLAMAKIVSILPNAKKFTISTDPYLTNIIKNEGKIPNKAIGYLYV